MQNTGIKWAEKTWNTVTGCTKIAEGCKNCYAERSAKRSGHYNFNQIRLHEDRLDQPMRIRKPSRIFVNSMSDLFHDDVPTRFISQVFAVMDAAKKHTFIILTKRPKRMRDFFMIWDADRKGRISCQINVILGVSVSTQADADKLIPILMECPSACRLVSYEPVLEAIDFRKVKCPCGYALGDDLHCPGCDNGIDWLICGGESGHNARPMHQNWARSARNQAVAAGVPFFFNQWGEWLPWDQSTFKQKHNTTVSLRGCLAGNCKNGVVGQWLRFGNPRSGRLLDGREWNEYPEGF